MGEIVITVVGIGPGVDDYITPIARSKAENAEVLIGSKRLLNLFPKNGAKRISIDGDITSIIDIIDELKESRVTVLVSGDPGLFSLLGLVRKRINPNCLEVIPGVSSAQLLFARKTTSWDDILFVTLHGRTNGAERLIKAAESGKRLAVFNGPGYEADKIAITLLNGGYSGQALIGQRLSYNDETVEEMSIEELSKVSGIDSAVILLDLKKKEKVNKARGLLYGIGIGTGEPEYITIKAAKAIRAADYVFVPRSADKASSLAESIAKQFLLNDDRVIELTFPMTRDKSVLEKYWKEAAEKIEERLSLGDDVAFLTLGDPSLYSTFSYLAKYLKLINDKAEIEIIPGVSSPFASAAAAGITLAEGGERVAIVPMEDDVKRLSEAIDSFDTTIVLKIGKKIDKLLMLIDEKNLQSSSAIVKSVGLPDESIIKGLEGVKVDEKIGYFSTAIIKKR